MLKFFEIKVKNNKQLQFNRRNCYTVCLTLFNDKAREYACGTIQKYQKNKWSIFKDMPEEDPSTVSWKFEKVTKL